MRKQCVLSLLPAQHAATKRHMFEDLFGCEGPGDIIASDIIFVFDRESGCTEELVDHKEHGLPPTPSSMVLVLAPAF